MIPPNVKLVTAEFIATVRGVSRETVYTWADGAVGEDSFLWVFNVGSKPDTERDLRFWSMEVLNPQAQRKLKLEDVVRQIVPRREQPGQFCGMANWELGDLLRVTRQQLVNLRPELQPVARDNGLWVPRQNIETFFLKRWCYHQHNPIQSRLI